MKFIFLSKCKVKADSNKILSSYLFVFLLTNISLASTEYTCLKVHELQNKFKSLPAIFQALTEKANPTCVPWIYASCNTPYLTKNVFDNLKKPLKPINKNILERAQNLYLQNEANRRKDLKTILDLYTKEQIPLSISNNQLIQSIETLDRHIIHLPKSSLGIQSGFLKRYVSDQMKDAAEDIKTKWKDQNGMIHEDTEEGFLSVLKKTQNNFSKMSFLISTANENSERGHKDFEGNLTPYHAKMLIIFHLENQLILKYTQQPARYTDLLNRLAKDLILKSHYGANDMKWSDIVPHDGFVIGASAEQISNFIKDAPSYQKFGRGIDCTTFVQNILITSGYNQLNQHQIGRLTSYGAVSKHQLQSIASIAPLKSLNDIMTLTPGDLILQREDGEDTGHVEIFAGFEGDPAMLVTINASGGMYRSIIKRYIDLTPELNSDCNKTSHFVADKKVHFFKTLFRNDL